MALHVVPKRLETELQREAEITPREYAVLRNLAENGEDGLSVNQLAALVGLSPSRASRLAESLTARGEVKRRPDETSGRSRRLTISETGLARIAQARAPYLAIVRRRVIDRLNPATVLSLTAVFHAMLDKPQWSGGVEEPRQESVLPR
jgi:DNA-binding MarR family transcriptional regulator